jgi:hypothetical protein
VLDVENSESNREAMLIYGKESQFGIYQIPDSSDKARDYMFENMERLEFRGLTVDRANYELVYTAPLTIHDRNVSLNVIYSGFQGENINRPAEYKARSVSVSDVIVLQKDGEVSSHFVDSYGYKELHDFTGHERQPVNENLMTSPKQNNEIPTVAGLKADLDEGKSISLMDLSIAVKAEQKSPVAKSKPSLLDTLQRNKQKASQAKQSGTHNKSNVPEV